MLFIGLAFLARFAVEQGLVPPQLRLAGIGLVASVLLVIGFRLRERRTGYALTLQGAGVAILYLTLFAAFRLYGFWPATLAFGLMVAVCAGAAMLAVLQDARALAVIGAAGGFVAPILASTGQGDHVALFSYYMVLNLGILAVAWRKEIEDGDDEFEPEFVEPSQIEPEYRSLFLRSGRLVVPIGG